MGRGRFVLGGNGQALGVQLCKKRALPGEWTEEKMRAGERTHRDLIVPKNPQSSRQPHNSGLRVLLPLTPPIAANAPDRAQCASFPSATSLATAQSRCKTAHDQSKEVSSVRYWNRFLGCCLPQIDVSLQSR
jgi:hypothetical protein